MSDSKQDGPRRLLFVCTGNICRSPTAEAVVRKMADDAWQGRRFTFESAGTHGWHVGHAPDRRAIAAAARRGYDLRGLRARKVEAADFERFDMILAMDRSHHGQLLALCPEGLANKLRLFLEFAPPPSGKLDVPDPYFGDERDFERMLDLVERGARGLLTVLTRSGPAS